MAQDFVKAASNNLPNVDYCMIHEYYLENMDYISAEYKNVKNMRAARSSYGDDAIGYVQVKRNNDIVIVKGRITPEHKVRTKLYEVSAKIDTKNGKILSSTCVDCTASSGGCKHAIAFLYWLLRRSEEKSPTSQECYWNKPLLSKVGSSVPFIKAKDLKPTVSKNAKSSLKKSEEVDNFSSDIFDEFLLKATEKRSSAQIVKYYTNMSTVKDNLSLHDLSIKFKKGSNNLSPESFLLFCKQNITTEVCSRASQETILQSKSSLWYEIRYARVTASKLFETSQCKTPDGSLVETLFGAYSIPETEAINRGKKLEGEVIKTIQKKYKNQRFKCIGLVINKDYPIFGASPDAVSEDYVVEVKCPSRKETVKNYLNPNNTPKIKCLCQIYLQMLFCNKTQGLFCIASPNFENDNDVSIYEVKLNRLFLEVIMENALEFWKKHVFPHLIK